MPHRALSRTAAIAVVVVIAVACGSSVARACTTFCIRDGDRITIDAKANVLSVDLDDAELEARHAEWVAPPLKETRGTLHKYIKCVKNASEGCVTDE